MTEPTGPMTATEIRQRNADRDRAYRERPAVSYTYGFDIGNGASTAFLTIAAHHRHHMEIAAMLSGVQAIVVHELLKQKTEPSNSTQDPSNRSDNVPNLSR